MGSVQLSTRHVTMMEAARRSSNTSVCLCGCADGLCCCAVFVPFSGSRLEESDRERCNKKDSFVATGMKRKCNLTTHGCTFLNSPSAMRGQSRESRGGGGGGGGGGVHCLRT